MERVYNFSAGPSMLPLPVLERAQRDLVNYPGAGMSVMEMSHRSAAYEDIIHRTEASLRAVSYTHLDVYKRQMCGRMSFVLHRPPANPGARLIKKSSQSVSKPS